MQALNGRVYEYESLLYEAGKTGALIPFFIMMLGRSLSGEGLRYMPRLTGSPMMEVL